MSDRPKDIIILGYDGVQTLDLTGPLDAFDSANDLRPGCYRTRVASLGGKPFASAAGLTMQPHCAFEDVEAPNTLIVPGGAGLRRPDIQGPVSEALRRVAPRAERLVSICTGIYGVAAAGLLDGKRATTHWQFESDVARRFPKVRLETDPIFIKDGKTYSSAGISSAIDLSLALIEEDFGASLASAVARDLVVYLKRSGGQRQYSAPLRFQTGADDRFAGLASWIAENLHRPLTNDMLAERACISPRQFSRKFKQMFGMTPAHQIELLRLDAARIHLVSGDASVAAIAALVGFRSDDVLRRAFTRRFGVGPRDYRLRFSENVT